MEYDYIIRDYMNCDIGTINIIDGNSIVDIKILHPDKVVQVTFADGTVIKTICHESDVFDLNKSLYIAISKKKYNGTFTPEGIEYMAHILSMERYYVGIVNKALKEFNKKTKDNIKRQLEDDAKRISEEKKKAKLAMYKQRRREKAVEREINIQKEAYLRAMKELNE